MLRTDFPSREYDVAFVAPPNADSGLDLEEVDASQQSTARLEESPEVRVEVPGCLRLGPLRGLGCLLCLLFHILVGVH